MKINLIKNNSGILMPVSEEDCSYIDKIKKDKVLEVEVKLKRNSKFLRKFFALLDIGFHCWEPQPINSQYGIPQKNFKAFREWVTIKAGFFDVYAFPNGKIRIDAQSISFGSMTEEDFAELYSNAIDVLLQDILKNYKREDIEEQVTRVLNFT